METGCTMSTRRSPSATPTPRSAPLTDSTSSSPLAPASLRRPRSPLRPLGSSPRIFESLLLSSPRNLSPGFLPEHHDSPPDRAESTSERLSPLMMAAVSADTAISMPDIRREYEDEEEMGSTFQERSRPLSRASNNHQITQDSRQESAISQSRLASSSAERHMPRSWYSREQAEENQVAREETRKVRNPF